MTIMGVGRRKKISRQASIFTQSLNHSLLDRRAVKFNLSGPSLIVGSRLWLQKYVDIAQN